MFCAHRFAVLFWYSFRRFYSFSHALYRFCQSFVSSPSIDIHGELRRGVAGELLCFFYADSALYNQIDIGHPKRVEIDLAAWGVLRYAGCLQIGVQVACRMRRDIEKRFFRDVPSGALACVETLLKAFCFPRLYKVS